MSGQETSQRQEAVDRFYWSHGRPCCAGCDWWLHLNSVAGECRRAPPISGGDRAATLGISAISLHVGGGQAMTTRDHYCGEFRDSFDWSSLPPAYQRRVGVVTARLP